MDRFLILTLYSRPGCHLCEDMKALIERVRRTIPDTVRVTEVDVSADPELERRYGQEIPVLEMNGKKVAKYRVKEEDLRRMLGATE